MNSPLIALESISKSFAEKNVLQNVSMTVNRGEITTIIGPNGAGKSSLVRVILGLITPDQGNIKRSKDLVIGYMPQKNSYRSHITNFNLQVFTASQYLP